jgi:hypothetical protein
MRNLRGGRDMEKGYGVGRGCGLKMVYELIL